MTGHLESDNWEDSRYRSDWIGWPNRYPVQDTYISMKIPDLHENFHNYVLENKDFLTNVHENVWKTNIFTKIDFAQTKTF